VLCDIGAYEAGGSSVVCFCVLRSGVAPTEGLCQELMGKVVEALGKPLRPREIRFVKDLPKTRNAKVMRRLIRSAFLGRPLGDTTSLENPGAVEEIKNAE
jgi:acetyl-CoA synthetase